MIEKEDTHEQGLDALMNKDEFKELQGLIEDQISNLSEEKPKIKISNKLKSGALEKLKPILDPVKAQIFMPLNSDEK